MAKLPILVLSVSLAACGDSATDTDVDALDTTGDSHDDVSSDGNGDAGDDVADIEADLVDAADTVDDSGADVVDAADIVDTTPDVVEPTRGEPAVLPIEPLIACAPTGTACGTERVVTTELFASYRKDFFYPYADYPEARIADPVDGGRVQIVGIAQASGDVTAITINGVEVIESVSTALTAWRAFWDCEDAEPAEGCVEPAEPIDFTWYHVYPRTLVAGEPFFVAFHTRNPAWNALTSASVEVTTTEGQAANANVTIEPAGFLFSDGGATVTGNGARVMYVTPDDDASSLLIHLHNFGESTLTLERLLLDGDDATSTACVADSTIAPGQTLLLEVPACATLERGDVWTVVAEFDDGSHAAAGGRILPFHFGIHTWGNTSDCVFPGGDDDVLAAHIERGFDTFFVQRSVYGPDSCDTTSEAIQAAAAALDDVWLMLERGLTLSQPSERIVWFVGDEPDQAVEARPADKAAQGLTRWVQTPEFATYVGGSRHRFNGAFAGTTDIQGFDVYPATCPPYILDFGNYPPLDIMYTFGRAVRFNHAPWPTWQYTQGFSPAWDPDDDDYNRGLSPTEARILAFTNVLAGVKGLMYFQTNQRLAGLFGESWDAIGLTNWSIRAVREWLLEGDPIGATSTAPDVLVEAIRGPDAIVVPVANVTIEEAVTDARCLFEENPHWIVADVSTDVAVDLPDDFRVADVFEVYDGRVRDPEADLRIDGRTLVFDDVAMSNAEPVRLFVIAGSTQEREKAVSNGLPDGSPLLLD